MEVGIAPSYSFNPRMLSWQHLEKHRLESLGIPNRYSRYLNAYPVRSLTFIPQRYDMSGSSSATYPKPSKSVGFKASYSKDFNKIKVTKSNSLAPFCTMGKPTCGYFFSRDTDNKRSKFGIPPSNLVQWRSSC